jgi:hypothetical protein
MHEVCNLAAQAISSAEFFTYLRVCALMVRDTDPNAGMRVNNLGKERSDWLVCSLWSRFFHNCVSGRIIRTVGYTVLPTWRERDNPCLIDSWSQIRTAV